MWASWSFEFYLDSWIFHILAHFVCLTYLCLYPCLILIIYVYFYCFSYIYKVLRGGYQDLCFTGHLSVSLAVKSGPSKAQALHSCLLTRFGVSGWLWTWPTCVILWGPVSSLTTVLVLIYARYCARDANTPTDSIPTLPGWKAFALPVLWSEGIDGLRSNSEYSFFPEYWLLTLQLRTCIVFTCWTVLCY